MNWILIILLSIIIIFKCITPFNKVETMDTSEYTDMFKNETFNYETSQPNAMEVLLKEIMDNLESTTTSMINDTEYIKNIKWK
jgi:hypothetical protein